VGYVKTLKRFVREWMVIYLKVRKRVFSPLTFFLSFR